jgi:methyl-accepting chemotaxis protein
MLFARRASRFLIEIKGKIDVTSQSVKRQSVQLAELAAKLSWSSILQASAVHETTTIDEINATVENNLSTILLTKEISNKVLEKTTTGFTVMRNLDQAVETVNRQDNAVKDEVIRSHDEIQEIVALVNEIDARTKVINDIVFQTKLFSFNASVEAARVGAAGQGFAVVADEIGKLATMTGTTAIQILETLASSKERVLTALPDW